jgi:hypothetical protein
MTKDKFKTLCEEVLVPQLGDLMHVQLKDLHETLDIMSEELLRIGNKLEELSGASEEEE